MNCPKGLFISLAILAEILLIPIPTEQVNPVCLYILSLKVLANFSLEEYFFITSVISIYPSSRAINSILCVIFKTKL